MLNLTIEELAKQDPRELTGLGIGYDPGYDPDCSYDEDEDDDDDNDDKDWY
jgi:hypothetical protein